MAIIKCESCGADISDKAIKCPYCGNQRLIESEEKKPPICCEDCGEILAEDMDVCPKCGCPVSKQEVVLKNSSQSEDSPETANNKKEEKNKKKKIVIAVIAAIVILSGICIIVSQSKILGDKKTETVSDNHNDSYNNDFVGFWKVFALMGNDRELVPVHTDTFELEIKSNGTWNLTVRSDGTKEYTGYWESERIDGDDTLFCYDSNIRVAMGSLTDDGTLCVMFDIVDDDTMLLFEKD